MVQVSFITLGPSRLHKEQDVAVVLMLGRAADLSGNLEHPA